MNNKLEKTKIVKKLGILVVFSFVALSPAFLIDYSLNRNVVLLKLDTFTTRYQITKPVFQNKLNAITIPTTMITISKSPIKNQHKKVLICSDWRPLEMGSGYVKHCE